jgi:hypothetical protein
MALGLLLTVIVYSGTHLAPPEPPDPTLANVLRDVAQPTGFALFVGLVVAVPVALLHRWVRRLQLGRALAALSPEQRAEVLVPLREEPVGDTRKIVAALARDLRVPTELTPASAPVGRGDEASPAEQAP